ncbi:MAG: hypothetical protein A2X59_08015 [Nitrospirae bacterium GWC2_42_7]|nr:MAG: hypothetical protein A2X59_08015 [Nitrospirae bacterium GWC2_42_7]
MKKVKRIILATLMAVGIFAGSVSAEEPKFSGFASVDTMSNYVWRGIKLSNSWVLQPSVGISYGDFSANVWANFDKDAAGHNLTETDFTVSYSKSLGNFKLGGGYILYTFDGYQDTQEVFASLGYDTLLSPTLTVYYDFDEGQGAFVTASVSHAFELPKDISLNLGALASYNIQNGIMGLDRDGDKFSNFYNAEVSTALTIPVTKSISVTPKMAYSFALSNDSKNAIGAMADDGHHDIFYGGINLTWSF